MEGKGQEEEDGAWRLTSKVHGEGGATVFDGIHDSVVRKEREEL